MRPLQSYRVEPGQIPGGEIFVPGDKSISHRAVMLAGIAEGTTIVRGFLNSDDCVATLKALEQMGVRHRYLDDATLEIEGCGRNGLVTPRAPLDMGNSGTGMRLLLGLLAGQGVAAELTGDESLRARPMERIARPLREMGAGVTTTDGRPPVRLESQRSLNGISYQSPVASAQIKSAVLLAGLGATGVTRVSSPAPSRDHTERMLTTMGVELAVSEDGLTVELEGPVGLRSIEVDVPGDLSSAAFFLAGAVIGAGNPVVIRNVGVNPTRDGVVQILQLMGARIERENERQFGAEPVADLRVYPGELRGIEIPQSLVPLAIDELPVIFVAAASARGRTVVTGAAELRVKESDRLHVMAEALTAVGIAVEETPDGIVIEGGEFTGGTVESAGDHRIAMAFVIAGLVSRNPVIIEDTRPVATSFPGFVDVAQAAGLAIDVLEA